MSASSPAIFFIVGRGRSGTTLLSLMLSAHPQAAVAPEGFFLMNLQAKYGDGLRSRDRIDEFCRDVLAEGRMRNWSLDAGRLAERLRALKQPLTYARAALEVYRSHAQDGLGRPQVALIGDKNPHYSLMVPEIARLFPQARFIHMVRDYRDNVASFMEAPFDLADPEALAGRWRLFNAAILAAKKRYPDRFLRVRYRDLVKHPVDELERICGFLGVAFSERMLTFKTNQVVAGQAWHANLSGPLNEAGIDRWRGRLPRQTVANLERICGPLGDDMGFERECPRGSGSFLSAAKGWLIALITVAAEWLIFRTPAGPRIALLNFYRQVAGLA